MSQTHAKHIRPPKGAQRVRGASRGPCGYHLEHIVAHGPDHPDHTVLFFFDFPLDCLTLRQGQEHCQQNLRAD